MPISGTEENDEVAAVWAESSLRLGFGIVHRRWKSRLGQSGLSNQAVRELGPRHAGRHGKLIGLNAGLIEIPSVKSGQDVQVRLCHSQ